MENLSNIPVPIIDLFLCNGCGVCLEVCIYSAIELRGGKAKITNPIACEYDGNCENICPVFAITRPFQIVFLTKEK
jgi:heterodisulfide reductase subunit A-like polyferredoxin